MTVSTSDIGTASMTYAQLVSDAPPNLAQVGGLAWTSDVGLVANNGTSWVSVSNSGGSAGGSVSVTLAASQDNLNPAGYVPGVTSRIIMTPASGGSAVLGLLAAPDKTSILIVNASATDSITFPYHGSSTSANQFSTQNAGTQTIEPLANAIISYVVNQWVFAS
jgi:hypothetical protein